MTKYTTLTVIALQCFANLVFPQVYDRPSYVIHDTGTIPFNDTIKTYVYFINDSILLVEETIILYTSDDRKSQIEQSREYAPWYYFLVNRNTKRHKLFKVNFQGEISFEGDNPMSAKTLPIDFLYGGNEPAYIVENFHNKSTRTDSSNVTIISIIPEKQPDFTHRLYFKKRNYDNIDIPSLSPLADFKLNEDKFCYMTEVISNKEPNYFGRTQILRNYSINSRQKETLQKLLNRIKNFSD